MLLIALSATSVPALAATGNITKAKAKQIALADAEYEEDEVIFITAELNTTGNTKKYNIEFCHATTEYIYEIDAKTGDIISVDQDDEYYINPGAIAVTAD